MIIDKWDADEKARDIRTYETREGSLEALNHILKQYLLFKNRKIDPRKPLRNALDLIQNTLYYDKEFHKFALQNYRVYLYYDERNNRFYIGK
jgi:hypothetical protein